MKPQLSTEQHPQSISENNNRTKLLADIPVTEYQLNLAGISTAVLVGGEGPPVILLHGPMETSLYWMRVIPMLVKTHRVIVPDLPGHGSSKVDSDNLSKDLVFSWLSELIEQTCSSPPALVGNIIGGSIAAHYAINHSKQISSLVLVNSLGLGKFRPSPRFALGLFRFMIWPTEKNFNRFFSQCMYDLDDLRSSMDKYWEPFIEYYLECARNKERSDAVQFLMKTLGVPKIPSEDLEKVNVQTSLIWGRHDKANKLKIAETASKHYGWPLYVIEDTGADCKLEQPEEFVNTLYKTLNTQKVNYAN